MSLATRVTLLVAALVALCAAGAGLAVYGAVRRSAEAATGVRLDARLAWLEGALAVDLDDGEVELAARPDVPAAAPGWAVSTADGTPLWAATPPPPGPLAERVRRVTVGPPGGRPLAGARLLARADAAPGGDDRPAWDRVDPAAVPAAALAAARAAVPAFDVREAWRRRRAKKKDAAAPPAYDLRGAAADGRGYEVRVDAGGTVERARRRDAARFARYRVAPVPGDAPVDGRPTGDPDRLDLVLTASTPAAEAEAELARAARALWALGPAAVLATAAAVGLGVRWQLRPLARMAREAAAVCPDDVGRRPLGPAGSSPELVGLRTALDGALSRLAEAVGRERRFAATAAHELRTPLAQMRLTVDVALRRDREAGEYREALADVSADLDRLQRLVAGLLQLARGATAAGAARATPLGPAVDAAVADRGPATVAGPMPADLWVVADPDLLASAVGNVVENAARHAPGEPPTVRVEPAAGTVRVVVADRGPGVAAADRERVFEPLTRLDRVAAGPQGVAEPTGGGVGLGLAVARAVARSCGGDLLCRPRADGAAGAEFVFTLRRAEPPDSPPADH